MIIIRIVVIILTPTLWGRLVFPFSKWKTQVQRENSPQYSPKDNQVVSRRVRTQTQTAPLQPLPLTAHPLVHIQHFNVMCDSHSLSPASILDWEGNGFCWVFLTWTEPKRLSLSPHLVPGVCGETLLGSTQYWEMQDASWYLRAGGRSPVQPADEGLWARFSLTAQEGKRKPRTLQSLGQRDLRKQLGHSVTCLRTRSTPGPALGNGTLCALEGPHEKGCLYLIGPPRLPPRLP